MADDIFDDGPPKKHAQAVEGAADAYNNLKNAQERLADVASPDLKALQNFEDMANAQGNLADHIKQSTQEIIKQAREIGSLRSQIDDVTGAVTGFGRELKKTASITHQYSLAMKEFKQGSEAYTQSLALSTAKLGKASAETTKFMKATQHAYNEAYNVAKIYGIEIDTVRQQMDKLQITFASQLSATDNQGKALVRLTKEAMMFARTAGVDTSEAIQRMDERMRGSTMTMEEVRIEQMLVMKEMDNYKKKLQELGKEAMKTGNITSKDLVKALQQIRQEFKLGAYDAGAFSKSLTALSIKGKKMGFTPEQLAKSAVGLGEVFKQLGSAQSYVGMTAAQKMLANVDMFAGTGLETRMGEIKKAVQSGDMSNVRAYKVITEATSGNAKATAIQSQVMRENFSPELLALEFENKTSMGANTADLLSQFIHSGKVEQNMNDYAKKSDKEKKKDAEAFATPMEKLVKEAHTAQDTRHKMAKTVFDFKQTVTKWIEKYWYMMALIQAGGGLLGRGGGLGGAGGRAGGALGGAGGMLRGAGTLFALAATAKGYQTAYETYQKGDTALAAGQAAAPSFTGGYKMGQAGEKAIGKEIAKGMSLQERTTLGKDTSLTNILGTMAMDNKWVRKAITGNIFAQGAQLVTGTSAEGIREGIDTKGWEMIKKERIGLGWKDFNAQKAIYKGKEREVKALEEKKQREGYLSKAEEQLLDQKRDEIRLMEKRIAGLKRAIEEERGPKRKKIYKREAGTDIMDAFMRLGGVKSEDIETTEDLQAMMNMILKQSVRARKGGRGAMESLAEEGGARGFHVRKVIRRAGELGFSKEEFGQMWEHQAKYIQAQLGNVRLRQEQMLKAPVSAPEARIEELKAGGQRHKIDIAVQGDDKGSTGEETVVLKPDGGVEKTTVFTAGLKAVINVSGETARKKAYNSKQLRMRDQGNKQAG